MKNRRRSLGVVAAVTALALAIAWFRLGPGEVPSGQPPLVRLDSESLQALRADFNSDPTRTRVIVLLSPT
jgi:hypothetical protein